MSDAYQSSYVLDADISKFFDRIDHDAILRVTPGPSCLIKAIRRLLKAGILEGVKLTNSETGTPQGGPLSPLLANLVLADLAASITREFPPAADSTARGSPRFPTPASTRMA